MLRRKAAILIATSIAQEGFNELLLIEEVQEPTSARSNYPINFFIQII